MLYYCLTEIRPYLRLRIIAHAELGEKGASKDLYIPDGGAGEIDFLEIVAPIAVDNGQGQGCGG